MKSFYIFLAISCFAVPQRNTTTTEIPRITTDNEISNVDRFDKKSRIINGSPILDARSFPSYASIRRLGHHLCGGVILDESRMVNLKISLMDLPTSSSEKTDWLIGFYVLDLV